MKAEDKVVAVHNWSPHIEKDKIYEVIEVQPSGLTYIIKVKLRGRQHRAVWVPFNYLKVVETVSRKEIKRAIKMLKRTARQMS